MKKIGFINLSGLEKGKILSASEMKNLLGGSNKYICYCWTNVGTWECTATSSSACGVDDYCDGGGTCHQVCG